MAKEKKYWSISIILEMLRSQGFIANKKILSMLATAEINNLGEWLYYKINHQEKDYITNRKVPKSIGTLFIKKEIVNWMERFEKASNGQSTF